MYNNMEHIYLKGTITIASFQRRSRFLALSLRPQSFFNMLTQWQFVSESSSDVDHA